MNTRISRHQMWMEMAFTAAKRSTCYRGNIGAVLVRDKRLLSIGYNGPDSGRAHCTGATCERTPEGGCARSIHAEANAIFRCNNPVGAELYCTSSPCITCAQMIVRHRLETVYYSNEYRDRSGVDHLSKHGVRVRRLCPNGMLVNPFTNELEET